MNGFSVPRSWHWLRYVNFPILAGSGVTALPACPECQKDFLWHLQPSQQTFCLTHKSYTHLELLGMLAVLCMKEQILARNSGGPWSLSGTHSVSVEGLRKAGSCSCAPALQQDRQAGCSLGHSWAGKVQNQDVHGNKQKGGACEPLLCCTNKNSSNLIT